jgi:hypothetical protein
MNFPLLFPTGIQGISIDIAWWFHSNFKNKKENYASQKKLLLISSKEFCLGSILSWNNCK